MTDFARTPQPRGFGWVIALSAIGVATLVAIAALRRDEAAPLAAPVVATRPTPRAITRPDSAGLSRAAERGAQLPRLKSMIVSWKGDIALERYYHGATRTSPANIKSASKTVMSALVGIAIARGDISGVDRTLGELLPAETAGLDTAKRAISVRDLITMRAGLQSTSFENYGSWVGSRNWVRDALRRPMVASRGDGGPMIYSTGSTHLLSAALTRATRANTHAYADRHLFRPLGFPLRTWTTDPQGIYFGGNEMRLTPREMLAFGNLYLNGGMAGSRQIISREWIDSSWVPRTRSGWSGHEYGYGWWMRYSRGYRVYFAWGYGGQFIFVIPELHAVVVTTSFADVERERGHNSEIHAILDDEIVPALGG